MAPDPAVAALRLGLLIRRSLVRIIQPGALDALAWGCRLGATFDQSLPALLKGGPSSDWGVACV